MRGQTKVLIVFLHGVGDGIVATPAVRAFKDAHPSARVCILVRGDTDAADVWSDNPAVDSVVRYHGAYPPYWHPLYHLSRRWTLARELRLIARDVGANRVVHVTTGALPTICKRFFRFPPKQDAIARELGVHLSSRIPELFPSRAHRTAAADFLGASDGAVRVAVNRCGSAYSKFWDIHEYETFCEMLSRRGYSVVQCQTLSTRKIEIVGDGRASKAMGAISTDTLGDAHLLVTAAILEKCDAVVTVDSGILALAAAARRPTIGIFTRKAWKADNGPIWAAPFLALEGQASSTDTVRALDALFEASSGAREASANMAARAPMQVADGVRKHG